MTGYAYDVAVVGGGLAGIAAAVAAATNGARTLLIERSEVLGGNATNAMVHSFCGLYAPASEGDPVHVNPGFPRRFADGLRAAGGAGVPERVGRVFVLPTYPDVLEAFAAQTCAQTPDLEYWLQAEVVAVALPRDVGPCSTIQVRRGLGDQTVQVEARIVVDATGDATVSALGGAACAQAAPEQLQAPSFIFRLSGVEDSNIRGYARLRLTYAIAHGVQAGELPPGCESVLVRAGALPGDVYVTLNMARLAGRAYAPLEAAYVRELEGVARARAERLVEFLQRTRPGFERCVVSAWPRRIGIRETRRMQGRAMLSAADVLRGVRVAEEVAVSSWPIELWPDHLRPVFEYPSGCSSIALDTLVSVSHPTLGAAGRCMSASHEALGAVRVLGTSMATGEAIGVAAAMAADSGDALWDVSPHKVRAAVQARAAA